MKKTYKVKVNLVSGYLYEIEADNETDAEAIAIEKANDEFDNGNYDLDVEVPELCVLEKGETMFTHQCQENNCSE